MNLAQLIDPQWVQERFPARRNHPPTLQLIDMASDASAPARAIGGVPKEFRSGVCARIRKVLGASKNPLNAGEIRATLRPEAFTPMQIGVNLGTLLRHGDVACSGQRGHYRYILTAKGRRRLA